MKTRTNLLKLLEEKEVLLKEARMNYRGPGLLKKFKILFRYRDKCLRYCLSKLNNPYLIKSKTFWDEDILVFLPENFAVYCFGILPWIELRLTKFLTKNLKDDSVFYDIGANCVYYSLLSKEIIKTGEIHSFEPLPKTFKILKENLSKKDDVFLNQIALFNKEGKIDFYDMTKINTGSSTCNPPFLGNKNHKFFGVSKKIEVQTTTLDNYCSNHSKPTFLKIDVEGAESQVIEGGIKTLKETNPIITMEIWRKPVDNSSYLKAIDTLYNLVYKSYKINNEGELEFIEKIDPERDILEEDMADNFIFKK